MIAHRSYIGRRLYEITALSFFFEKKIAPRSWKLGHRLVWWVVGPETIPLTVQSYEETSCPESLRQGRAGGALGAVLARQALRKSASWSRPRHRTARAGRGARQQREVGR